MFDCFVDDGKIVLYKFYDVLDRGVLDAATRLTETLTSAGVLAASERPENLSPQELDELEHGTIEAQGLAEYLHLFLEIEEGGLNDLTGMSNTGSKR